MVAPIASAPARPGTGTDLAPPETRADGRVSIVIPTLNEATTLEDTLRGMGQLDPPPWQVLVVDGGSQDGTVAMAVAAGFQVLRSEQPGRGVQMNLGARAATGDLLCFLHADTKLPVDGIAMIRRTLTNRSIAAVGFISLMDGAGGIRWGISLMNYLKTYLAPLLFRPLLFGKGLRLLFGDQVMACRREDFWACGGFDADLPIMEDGDLCLRLVRRGRIVQIHRVVRSSDRRVLSWGPWKAASIYLWIGVLWGMGVSPSTLHRFYEDIR